jgi:hypothetical protein
MPTLSDPATIYTPEGGGQQHVFYLDDQGDIRHVFYDMVSHKRTSDPPWATHAGSSNLAAMHTPNQQHVFYLGGAGAPNGAGMYHVFYDMTTGGPLAPEQWVVAGPATQGATGELLEFPSTMNTSGGQQHLFFAGTDPKLGIYQVFYDPQRPSNPHRPAWQGGTREQWVAEVGAQPVTMYTPNGQQHVFYRAGDRGIYQVFYDPDNSGNKHSPLWQGGSPEQWVSGAGASGAAGDPVAMYTPNGQQHIFYRGNDNGVYQVFFDPNDRNNKHSPLWQGGTPEQWAPNGGRSSAAGDPATLYTPDGQQHVFYRGIDGGIYHVFYDPNNLANPSRPYEQGGKPEVWVTGIGAGALAVGDPSTMYTPGGQQHVFYRGSDSGIYQVFYDPRDPGNPHGPYDQGGSPEQWA